MTELDYLSNIEGLLLYISELPGMVQGTSTVASSDQLTALINSVNYYGSLGCGLLMALIFATTWKG